MHDQIEDGMRFGGTALRRTVPDRAQVPDRGRAHPARVLPRRGRAPGPRPVRPVQPPRAVRPVQPPRPDGDRAGERGPRGGRVLLRSIPVLPPRVLRRRRVAAAVGTALLTAAVVVLLGLLADVAAAARHSAAAPEVTSTSLTPVVASPVQVAGVLGG